MGSSLGYGQGMEYQYVNAPQPSQPMPVLRPSRLELLRAERMNRQQPGGPRDQTNRVPATGTAKISSVLSGLFSSPSVPPPPPMFRSTYTSVPVPPPVQGSPPAPTGGPLFPPVLQGGTPPPVSAPLFPPVLQGGTSAPDRPPLLQGAPAGLPLSLASRPLPSISLPQKQEPVSKPTGLAARTPFILTSSFVVGRILGLLRNSLFVFIFGASALSDAYLQALLLPDLLFNLIAGGALSSAFIPVFTYYLLGEKNEHMAWRIASSVLNLVLAILCVLALLAIILAPWLVPLYTPHVSPVEMALIVSLTRLMLVQSVIMGGGVIVNSVLYTRQNFLLPALGTVLYNVGLILGLLPGFFLVFFSRTPAQLSFAVYCATWGVVLGAILQVGIQIPGILKARMRYTFVFDWKDPGVRQIVRQMLPRVLNAAMLYCSTFIDRILILALAAGPLLIQPGLVTQYYLALQLLLLPLGIFGMTVSTAAFPPMAENVALGRLDRVRAIIEDTLRSILFLSIPTSVGLIILGLPIIQVLLQHGAFDLDSASSTSVPLAFFAVGLAGLASVEILTRAFYAFRDSKTPVIVSVAQFVLKIVLSLILMSLVTWGPSWKLGALAFATSLAGLLEAGVLLWLLQKKIGLLKLRQLAVFAGRVLLASLIMAAGLLLLRTFLDVILITTTSPNLGILGAIFAIFKLLCELFAALLVYVWATRQLGIEDFWKQGPVRRVLERFKLSWI
jgi:putative peptidoglycan lipid II flippase